MTEADGDADALVLTPMEAAYVVAALKITLDHCRERLQDRDRAIIADLIHRLAAPLNLDDEVRLILGA